MGLASRPGDHALHHLIVAIAPRRPRLVGRRGRQRTTIERDALVTSTSVVLRSQVLRGVCLSIVIFIHQACSNINNYKNWKLNYKHSIEYYRLLQNWQKQFNVEIYRNIKLLVLPFLRTHARQINSKATLTIFYYINTPSFKKSFIQRRLKLKSEECRSALPDWKQSNPYNEIGVHLVITSSKVIFYASALCALTRCPSVRLCPSITSRSSIETDEGDWYWCTVSLLALL